jgi:hypothetical protein
MGANHSSPDIQSPLPMRDFIFRGKWLSRYDPGEFTYHETLTMLPHLQTRLEHLGVNYKFLYVTFNRNVRRSSFFLVGDQLFIRHNGSDKQLVETDPGAFAVQTFLEPLSKPIRSVNLLFPRLESDPRWKTMGLPSGQLFLASSLQASGFEVNPLPLVLPALNMPTGGLEADLAGFTLFEDLLPVLKPFLAHFQAVYNGWMAAGGPFPTLAPLAAIYHLPHVNLFVRGEAELALPDILKALNQGDVEALFKQVGLFWQRPGLIAMSDFGRVNRPETFNRFQVNFNFLRPEHLKQGLEMNFSRGCGRRCAFCCRVQGTKFRQLSLEKTEEFLEKYKEKIAKFEIGGHLVRTVNINDDDILQDPAYAAAIFALLKKHGFRIIGIQTAPASLIKSGKQINSIVLDLAADPELYADSRPLFWLGTDVFLPQRAQRLGKLLPSPELFASLLAELEKRGLRHFHYWISSDGASNWEEFIEELALIINYYRNFANFGLLAHAPFIVPYPASLLFQRLPANAPNLKIKLDLPAPDPRFGYQVVDRLETLWPQFNNLLKNEKAGGEFGFFDFLKTRNFKAVAQGGQTNQIRQNRRMICAAAQLAYHFLKQEQLMSGSESGDLARGRIKLEELIQSII